MKRLWFVAPVLALLTGPLAAGSIQVAKPEEVGFSSERLARFTETVKRHIDVHDIAGAVTLVARRGRIVQFEAYGLADLDTRKPMSKDSLFWIASMSKPITGVAILMLLEEGKVRLTDPVSKFIPEFHELKVATLQEPAGPAVAGSASGPPQYYPVPANREITVRDLLSHVSGLASRGTTSTAEVAKDPRRPGETLASYIPRLGATTLDFQPGTRWSYSPSAGFDTQRQSLPSVWCATSAAISAGGPKRWVHPATSAKASSMEIRSTRGVKSLSTLMAASPSRWYSLKWPPTKISCGQSSRARRPDMPPLIPKATASYEAPRRSRWEGRLLPAHGAVGKRHRRGRS
jgi:hypothetical protein